MTATDDLIDAFDRFGPVLEPDDTRRLLGVLTRAHHRTLVRWLVDTVGTDPVVSALADVVDPGNLVAAMVEQGVLMRATDVITGAPYWFADGEPTLADAYDPEGLPEHAEPLYRAAEPGEDDRG